MDGAGHYREAENLLAMAVEQQMALATEDPTAGSVVELTHTVARAQVHATLALAAATAPRTDWTADLAAWQDVAAPKPEGQEEQR